MKNLVMLIACLCFASCSTTINKSYQSGNVAVNVASNLKADISVDMNKKLKGVASKTKFFGITTSSQSKFADGVAYGSGGAQGFFSMFDSKEEVKSAAAYNALNGTGADVIVAPQYLIEEHSFLIFYSKTTVMVTGYPGVIKKIE